MPRYFWDIPRTFRLGTFHQGTTLKHKIGNRLTITAMRSPTVCVQSTGTLRQNLYFPGILYCEKCRFSNEIESLHKCPWNTGSVFIVYFEKGRGMSFSSKKAIC
jgi:hypothetical protein